MNIFESLENLNVSEECFDDIVGLVEDLVSKTWDKYKESRAKMDDPEIKRIGDTPENQLTPEEKEKYYKVAGEHWKNSRLNTKAVNMRDKSEWESRGHNRKGETKGERNQRSADYRNPRYSGENGMYIKDRRAKQDAESGYNVAINKAIRRHNDKKISEALMEELMGIVEDIVSAIDKSSYSPKKKEELKREAEANKEKELHTLHNYKKLNGAKVPFDIELKRKETKNIKGEYETDERRAKGARSKFKELGMFDKGYEQARDRFQRALDVERKHNYNK